jgi:hypothetical protein
MMATIFFVLVGIAILAVVVILLRRPAAFLPSATPGAPINLEDLAARHCRYFPQLRQSLFPADEAYLTSRVSPGVLREWRESRRRVMRGLLAGLYEDFARLNRMARAVSRVAPQLDNLREAELFWLGLRFRLFYRLALLELGLGHRPVNAYLRLTAMIGGLGSNLERAAAALAEESALGRLSALSP